MGTAVLPPISEAKPRELLKLVALPSEMEHAPKQLSGSANELIRSVVSIMDAMLVRMVRERTADDFAKTREEVFPQYFAAMVALGVLVNITVPKRDLAMLAAQSLSELEAEFRDKGPAAIGSDLSQRGLFTVWVLRKISDLAEEIGKLPTTGQADEEMGKKFAIHAMWARFHIDCLVKSMNLKVAIFPPVIGSIVDGLRSAVNAYAWIRQAVDVGRTGRSEPELPPVKWTEEDEALLSDSMRDLTREES
jgi:hypothetical protein